MKAKVFNAKFTLLAAVIAFSITGILNAQEASKEIAKTYQVDQVFTLGIENKYGSIDVVNWDKNEMEVVVTIRVAARSEKKSQEILEKISIDIDESSSGVDFKTMLEWKSLNNVELDIDYKVKTPEYINTNLTQKYGEVYIQSLTGDSELTVKYGELNADNLVNIDKDAWNTLKLAYSEADIDRAGNLDATIAYSELEIDEANMLSLESSYSEITGDFIGGMDMVSKYDEFAIDEVVDWKAEMKYGEVEIGSVNNSFVVSGAYTDIEIGKVLDGFSSLDFDLSYGDISAGIPSGTGYSINADITYGDIDIPRGSYAYEEKGNHIAISGTVGNGSGASVKVRLRYGDIELD